MKSHTLLFVFSLFTIFSFAQENVLPEDHPGTLVSIEQNFPNSEVDGYNLYIPKSCTSKSKQYPVLVFLQGGLGVGGDPIKILNWGLPKRLVESTSLKSELDKYMRDTFVIVMPHIDGGQFYQNEAAFREILEQVEKKANVDMNRIYLTGLSRGAHGTWGLACRMNDTFAAYAPICGRAGGITDYKDLANLPIWVSHNTGDGIVDYDISERIVEKIEAVDPDRFHRTTSVASADYQKYDLIFTSKPGGNHDAWTEMYTSVNFYKWLLRFEKED